MSDVIITDEKVYRDMCQRIMHHYHASGQSFVDGALDCVMTALKPINSNAPQWISVSERLPELHQHVITWTIDDNDKPCAWMATYNDCGFIAANAYHDRDVTYWMPINPPTEST